MVRPRTALVKQGCTAMDQVPSPENGDGNAWGFYRDIGLRMAMSLKSAVLGLATFVSAAFFVVTLFGSTWEPQPGKWDWLSPRLGIIPLIATFLFLFFKAIYDKWREREIQFHTELMAAKPHSIEAESIRITSNALVSRLVDVKRAGEQHANSSPSLDSFTRENSDAWIIGACSILEKTVNLTARNRFTAAGTAFNFGALCQSVAEFRGVIADLRVEDLRQESAQALTQQNDWQAKQRVDESKRVETVSARIRSMINKISVPRTPGIVAAVPNYGAILASMHGSVKTDWKSETRAELQALVSGDLNDKYDKCLKQKEPALAAKAFLEGLASHLKVGDLR